MMKEQLSKLETLQAELEANKKLIRDLQAKLAQVEQERQVKPRAERVDLKSPVEFIGDFDIVHGEGINISDNGICFNVKKALPIEMHYMHNGIQQHRRAELVWMKELPEEGYRFGLKFIESDDNNRF